MKVTNQDVLRSVCHIARFAHRPSHMQDHRLRDEGASLFTNWQKHRWQRKCTVKLTI